MPAVSPRTARLFRPLRRLGRHLRHRFGTHQRRFSRLGGQPARAVRRVLYARQPQGRQSQPAPPLPQFPRPGSGTLRPGPARHPARAGPRRPPRPVHRPAHPRRVQLRFLRAYFPGPRAGRRTRRGPRPHRQRRHRLYADYRGPAPRGCHLPPRGRRFHRPLGLSPRLAAGRPRPAGRRPARQCYPRQRPRHRRGRRQKRLCLCPRYGALLSPRGTHLAQCGNLPLPPSRRPGIHAGQPGPAGGQAGGRFRRLWYAHRPPRHAGGTGGVRQRHPRPPRRLHFAAHAGPVPFPLFH